jgi:hypothetical protein
MKKENCSGRPSDEGLTRQYLQIVDLGFRRNRGQVELESCQTNKCVQLKILRWLGFHNNRSSLYRQHHLYIEGVAEAFRAIQVYIHRAGLGLFICCLQVFLY